MSSPETKNWISSQPIQSAALQAAGKLAGTFAQQSVPPPQIYPVMGGGIVFTWQAAGRELEIEILPDGSATYFAAQHESLDPLKYEEQNVGLRVRLCHILLTQLPDAALTEAAESFETMLDFYNFVPQKV